MPQRDGQDRPRSSDQLRGLAQMAGSHRAEGRINRRGSNRRWIKVQWQVSVHGRNDLEAAVAFRAVPKVDDVPLIPMLRPFGGNQLSFALDAFYSEA